MSQIHPSRVVRLSLWLFLALLLVPVPVQAWENGPSLGLKAGVQRLTSPVTRDKTTRARLELELASPRLLDGILDVSAAFGFSPLGSVSDGSSDIEEGLVVDRWYADELRLFDARVAARLYPLGRAHSAVAPYVGGGLGYFWFLDQWEDNVSATDPESGETASDSAHGTDTVAEGFFPFVVAGVNVSVSDHAELLFEVQYDVEKQDRGFDLGGPSYLIGARIRW
jgi:hypothetical protein